MRNIQVGNMWSSKSIKLMLAKVNKQKAGLKTNKQKT